MTRVVITGCGALSPLGSTPSALWRGVLEGRSGIRAQPQLAGLEVTAGGSVDDVPEQPGRDVVLATRAIDAALAEAGIAADRTGFVWGNALDTSEVIASPGCAGARSAPEGSAESIDGAIVARSAGRCFSTLARRFRAPRRMIGVACATGTAAIGEAFRLVRDRRVDACVAGGSSVMLGKNYVLGFHALRAVAADRDGEPAAAACKPFDRERRGFVLADGAGALVVESLDSARRRGAEPLAELAGYGASQDAFDLNRPPPDGAGALLAMQRALASAGVAPTVVDAVNAHGTGTLVGDVAEAAAVRALLGDAWSRTPVSSIKGAIGHTMAAAGALEAIVAIATCRTGIVPATANLRDPDEACAADHVIGAPRETGAACVLSVSFGMGGQNAAIVLRRFAP